MYIIDNKNSIFFNQFKKFKQIIRGLIKIINFKIFYAEPSSGKDKWVHSPGSKAMGAYYHPLV